MLKLYTTNFIKFIYKNSIFFQMNQKHIHTSYVHLLNILIYKFINCKYNNQTIVC